MSKTFKEPRIYMCVAFIILLFLPWMEAEASAGGYSVSGGGISGFTMELQFITGFIPIAFPVIMLALEFVPAFKFNKRLIYLIGGLLSIILTFVSSMFAKSVGNSGDVDVPGMSVDTGFSYGIWFWVALVLLLAIVVVTIIRDFAINKDSLKEKGLKGAFSEMASQVKSETVEMAGDISSGGLGDLGAKMKETASSVGGNKCPNCGANVAIGKKFCAKCGGKMETASATTVTGAVAKPGKRKVAASVQPESMTVAEYIQTLPDVECEKCGTKVATNIKFCPDCGTKMVIKVAPEQCDKCKTVLIKGKKFCPDCGAPVVLRELITNCDSCGAELIYGKKFCVECGTKVNG